MNIVTERKYTAIQNVRGKTVDFIYSIENAGRTGGKQMHLKFTEDGLLMSFIEMYAEAINDPLAIMAAGEKHILDVVAFLKKFEWNIEFTIADKPHLSRRDFSSQMSLKCKYYFKVL